MNIDDASRARISLLIRSPLITHVPYGRDKADSVDIGPIEAGRQRFDDLQVFLGQRCSAGTLRKPRSERIGV